MASRRRSLEEKNLKILRELAALPANKQCFDCHQRGPTYINMTIGSFICTSCSGIVRGVTPPHRVKSITMTTFSPEEIEFLKSRGNEYCRYIWLGTYDSHTSNSENDGKDEHRKKDLMSQKYEKRRWYVDPDIALKKLQQDQQLQQKQVTHPTLMNSSSSSNNSRQYGKLPEVQPLSQLFGRMPTPLVVKNNQENNKWPHPVSSASANPVTTTKSLSFTHSQGAFDLLSEFGADTLVSPSAKGVPAANGNFANFESAFSSQTKTEIRPLSSSQSSNNNRKTYTPPTGWTSFEDDLDPLSPTAATTTAGISSSYSANSVSASMVSGVPTCTTVMPRPLSLPTFAPTNPFKTFPVNNPVIITTQWQSFAATSGITSMVASMNLDAFPKCSMAKESVFSPLPAPSSTASFVPSTVEQQRQQAEQDRYAALADLDSCFNQPTSTVPSWAIKTDTIVSTPTATTQYTFSSTEVANNSMFTTAPSNPFKGTTGLWSQNTVTSANPFKTMNESSLPYQHHAMNYVYAPLPVVGNSPSEESASAHYPTTSSLPFAPYSSVGISSPPNGYHGQVYGMQNGDILTSPTVAHTMWNFPPVTSVSSAFPTSQLTHSTSAYSEKRPALQYSDWVNSANPFMAGSGSASVSSISKSTSNNPFL